MTSGLRGESYEERCRETGLETLEARRKTQDITQVFKILTSSVAEPCHFA
jgi:hypothetical protein